MIFSSLLQLSCSNKSSGENNSGNVNSNKENKYVNIIFDKSNKNESYLIYINKDNRRLFLDNGLENEFDGIYFRVSNDINKDIILNIKPEELKLTLTKESEKKVFCVDGISYKIEFDNSKKMFKIKTFFSRGCPT